MIIAVVAHPILLKLLRLAALLLLYALAGGNARAAAPRSSSLLLQPNPALSGTLLNEYTGSVGTQFRIKGVMTLNQLGFYDNGGNGLAASHKVRLWVSHDGGSTGTIVAEVTVPAGTGATLSDGFRWVALTNPVTISAQTGNDWYCLSADVVSGDGDSWYNYTPTGFNYAAYMDTNSWWGVHYGNTDAIPNAGYAAQSTFWVANLSAASKVVSTSITLNKSQYDSGEDLIITYANGYNPGADTIALCNAPWSPTGPFALWEYIGAATNGQVTLRANLPIGSYTASYLYNGTGPIGNTVSFTVVAGPATGRDVEPKVVIGCNQAYGGLADPQVYQEGANYYITGTHGFAYEPSQMTTMFTTTDFQTVTEIPITINTSPWPSNLWYNHIWAFEIYKHTDGTYHAYGYDYDRGGIYHFVPDPDPATTIFPVLAWKEKELLVSGYDNRVINDGTNMYMLAAVGDGAGNIVIYLQRMLNPGAMDPDYPPRKIMSEHGDGLTSELRNAAGAMKLHEAPNITKVTVGGITKYVLCYTVGDYALRRYKIGFGYSDVLVPPAGTEYAKARIPDPRNVWGSGAGASEVVYVAQTEKPSWPNYFGNVMSAPGSGEIITYKNNYYLLYHAVSPMLMNDMTGHVGYAYPRMTCIAPLTFDFTNSMDKWATLLLPEVTNVPSLAPSKASFATNENVVIHWTHCGQGARDWIGTYRSGESNNSLNLDWNYVQGGTKTLMDVWTWETTHYGFSGSMTFPASAPGLYDAVFYFSSGESPRAAICSYKVLGTSSLFTEGFESGNWTTGGWTVSNTNAKVRTAASKTGTYGARLAGTTWIEKAFSTIGYQEIHVQYARATSGLGAGESLVVEWYNGVSWNTLESTQDTTYTAMDMVCGSDASNNALFKVRFSINASSTTEYAYVDDIQMTGLVQESPLATSVGINFQGNASGTSGMAVTATAFGIGQRDWFSAANPWVASDSLTATPSSGDSFGVSWSAAGVGTSWALPGYMPSDYAGYPGDADVYWGNLCGPYQVNLSGLAAQFPHGYVLQAIAADDGGAPQIAPISVTDGVTPETLIYTVRGTFTYNAAAGFSISTPTTSRFADTLTINGPADGAPKSFLAGLVITDKPVVTVPPKGVALASEGTITLNAGAVGVAPLSYQWRKGGVPISGATSATYTKAFAEVVDSGNYDVVVTNLYGSATSPAATVTVAALIHKSASGTDLTAGTSWVGGIAPGTSDIAEWSGSAWGAGLTLASSVSWGGIRVAGAASDINVTGAGPLTLGSSGIDLAAPAVNLKLATDVTLGDNQAWTVASGMTLTIGSSAPDVKRMIFNGKTLTIGGEGNTVLNSWGDYESGTLTKTGSGTLTITGNPRLLNSNVNIQGGVLSMQSYQLYAGYVHSSSGAITLSGGGVLELQNWGYGLYENLGYLRYNSDAMVINGGTIRMNHTAATGDGRSFTIGSGGATLEANGGNNLWLHTGGTIDNTANGSLTLTGSGLGQLDMVFSGTGGLTKSGTGTWTLTNTNTYSGETRILTGTLSLGTPSLSNTADVLITTGAVLNLNTGTTDTIHELKLDGVAQPAGVYGALSSSAQFKRGYITGNGTLTVTTGPANYTGWETTHGIAGAGAAADSDGDGIPNGIEFVIDGDPSGPNSDSSALLPRATLDSDDLIFVFRRTSTSASYNPGVEYGSTLSGWTPAVAGQPLATPVRIQVESNGFEAGVDRVTVRIPRALANSNKLFARLRVAITS